MPLLGTAAVAMWWTIRTDVRDEFGDWHSHEHFPERMSIPGFRRGSRWASTEEDGGFFVLYELESYDTLTSRAYLERLNDPTPWSRKMMPHHLGMTRSQSRVLASHGGGVAGSLATIRFSPRADSAETLFRHLDGVLSALPTRPGLTGAHLLRTDAPAVAEVTTEQKIRGGDAAADWIVLLSGYDPMAVQSTVRTELSTDRLRAFGAETASRTDEFRLAFALGSGDI